MTKKSDVGLLKIERRKISDLKPWDKNPRRISKEALGRLEKSIEHFGFVEPVIVNKTTGRIVGGHQRLKALKAQGATETDVVVVEMDEGKEMALNIGLNSKGMVGEYDEGVAEMLAMIEKTMPEIYRDTGLVSVLDEIDFKPEVATQTDAEPRIEIADELQKKFGTERGQLWELGRHRVLCGDTGSEQDVVRVMGGKLASLVFCDPPYGVAIGSKNKMLSEFRNGGVEKEIEDDKLSPVELKQKLVPAFSNIKNIVISEDCTVFVTAPQCGELSMMMMMMMQESGLPIRHVLIWKKNHATFSMGRLDYDYQHEPILLTWGKRHKRPMKGQHKTSVWEIDKPSSSKEHPTMKPVELVVNCLLNNSDSGDLMFDGYLGSGTSVLAAEQTGRSCHGMEIDPGYVAVILQRYIDATGNNPRLIDA